MIRKKTPWPITDRSGPGRSKSVRRPRVLTPAKCAGVSPGSLVPRPCRSPTDGAGGVPVQTGRGNLVAVVSNGTRGARSGRRRSLAAKPMGEGMAVLLKRLADLDVFDLEVAARSASDSPRRSCGSSRRSARSNLKDIRAPEAGTVRLILERLHIPCSTRTLHGTAVVAAAALINALDLVDKRIDAVRVVLVRCGNRRTGCARPSPDLGSPQTPCGSTTLTARSEPTRGPVPFQARLARDDGPRPRSPKPCASGRFSGVGPQTS